MNISINIKSLLILIVGFILFTAVGTVSHEYGHITVAKYYGYETVLHYGGMDYYPKGYLKDKEVIAFKNLVKEYVNTGYDAWPNEVKEKAEAFNNTLQKRYWSEESNKGLFITIGGPLQTTLTGTIGVLLLVWRRKPIYKNGLKALDWLAVFLSLFWLREVFNLLTSVGGELISQKGTWFGGDELSMSQDLNMWSGTIPLVLATIGTIIAMYVVFGIVPKKIRPTFILSGIIGGIVGFILWMYIIGSKILP